jgi:uncharacterized protein (TIGR02757 family)
VNKRIVQIKDALEELYSRYNHKKLIPPDPLQFVYQYSAPADMEIAGLLSAALAYGRVQQIEKSLTDLFGRMGKSPSEFVRNFNPAKRNKLADFKHRFNTGDDISDLLELLQEVIGKFGSIEKFFARGCGKNDINITNALSKFCNSLVAMHGKRKDSSMSRGFKYLLSSPTNGSACKRLNLFLRWMVRDDDVDTGLWKSVDKSRLIVPMDVHMGRLTKILGFHDRKNIGFNTAVAVTECFAEIQPGDPVKYDFALSRVGIIENCNGQFSSDCCRCELLGFCQK